MRNRRFLWQTQDQHPNPKSQQREGDPDFEILEKGDLDGMPRSFDHDNVPIIIFWGFPVIVAALPILAAMATASR